MMPFDLMLFFSNPEFVREATASGVSTVVVDWESRGKDDRQKGYDTQISLHGDRELRAARECTTARVICRLNAPGAWTRDELERAIDLGADEIMIPMVRSIAEVESTLEMADGRCGVGALIETREAVALAKEIGSLPFTRVYVGLNDLCIDRGRRHIFEALIDGTVESVRRNVGDMPFGFGGLTLPEKGWPLAARHLIGEIARLRCQFSFLRRSFLRDIASEQTAEGISRLVAALERARERDAARIAADREELVRAVDALPPGPWPIAPEHARESDA